jgi:hypothetical protein
MSGHATNVVELAVGIGCLIAAFAVWRMRSLRWLSGLFALAGLAAAIHAIGALAS